VVLLVLIGGSGQLLQRGLGPRQATAERPSGETSGSWFCPHGGLSDGKGWVVLFNPGQRPVLVRLIAFAESGIVASSSFQVPPNRRLYRQVPAGDPAASTEVEYFGGWVAAAAVLQSSGATPAAAAERCVPSPRRRWLLPDGTTQPGQSSWVVVMNPFAEEATFHTTIRTEDRAIRPSELTPFVLPARSSVSIPLNRFALAGPNEQTITAEVRVRVGRVIAGGVTSSSSSLRAEAGISSPATRWILPGTGYSGETEIALMDPDARPAEVSVVAQGAVAQRLVSGQSGLKVGGTEVKTYPVDARNTGTVVQSANDVPVAATRRLPGENGDDAAVTGATGPSPAWLVLPAMPPSGGLGLLVLENPGPEAATVSIRLFGQDGPVAAPLFESVSVPAGRTIGVGLLSTVGRTPVAAVVEASRGTIVAGSASYSLGGSAYAATLGVPIPSSERNPVAPSPP
jgi:uncharacterized protein DUF5719